MGIIPLTDFKYNNIIFYTSYDFNIFHTIIDLLKNETFKKLNKKKIIF